MGRRRRRCRQVFFLLLLFSFLRLQAALLVLANSTATTTSSGRSSSHADANAQAAIAEEEESMMLRKTLGSHPPICEGRCRSSCGRRCEAVQVPVTPHDLLQLLRDRKKKTTLREAGAEGGRNHGGVPNSYDDRSNYKPLGWRCKCS